MSASASSPPPSPHRHPHALARSHSPIPHISTILPSHHHGSMYAPSTRAADISRLLDPAYASGSSSSSSTSTASPARPHHHHAHAGQTRAYVDRHGDLHDPDYRDFPVLPPPAAASRRRRPSHGAPSRSTSRHAEQPRYPAPYAIARPEWERDWAEGADEDEDEDALDDEAESQSHGSPFASHAAMRRASTIHSTTAYRPYAPLSYSDYSGDANPFSSSPVESLEDELEQSPQQDSPLYDTPFLADGLERDAEVRRRKTTRRCSGGSGVLGRKKGESCVKEGVLDASSEKSDAEPAAQQFSVDDELDDAPSCADILRQQWARVALSVKFSVFRARRRLRSNNRARSDTSGFPT